MTELAELAEIAPPAAAAEPPRRGFRQRTVAPWSWPLAEAETPTAPEPVPTEAGSGAGIDERAPGFDQGFFQRDEPVGSQFVDFDEVRQELVRIGVVWLGESECQTGHRAAGEDSLDDR